jgi:hypothetical protein
MVRIVEFTNAGEREDEVSVPMVVKSDAEWNSCCPATLSKSLGTPTLRSLHRRVT